MKALVAESLDSGAMDFSTGLFYAPGNYARLEEVIELAAVAAERGKVYSTYMRDEGSHSVGLFVAINEASAALLDPPAKRSQTGRYS